MSWWRLHTSVELYPAFTSYVSVFPVIRRAVVYGINEGEMRRECLHLSLTTNLFNRKISKKLPDPKLPTPQTVGRLVESINGGFFFCDPPSIVGINVGEMRRECLHLSLTTNLFNTNYSKKLPRSEMANDTTDRLWSRRIFQRRLHFFKHINPELHSVPPLT